MNIALGSAGIGTPLQIEVVEGEVGELIETRELKVAYRIVVVLAAVRGAELVQHRGVERVDLRHRCQTSVVGDLGEEDRQLRVRVNPVISVNEIPAAHLVLLADIPVDGDYQVLLIDEGRA